MHFCFVYYITSDFTDLNHIDLGSELTGKLVIYGHSKSDYIKPQLVSFIMHFELVICAEFPTGSIYGCGKKWRLRSH